MTRSLQAFYAYRILSRLYFHLPIILVFLLDRGLPLWQVSVVLATYGLTLTVSPRASGLAVARLGEKATLVTGEALKGFGIVLLVAEPHFVPALLAQIIGGLGYSVAAGPDMALLRKITGSDKDLFNKVQSNTQSYMFLSILVSSVLGGVFYAQSQVLPFVASILAVILGTGTLLFLPSVMRDTSEVGDASKLAPADGTLSLGATAVLHRFWMNYYALSRGVLLGTYVGLLPYFLFRVVRIELSVFGAVLASFTLFAFLSARYIVRISKRISPAWLTAASTGIMLAGLVGLSLFDSLGATLAAMALLGLAAGGVRPLTVANLGVDALSPLERGRLFSAMEQRFGICNAAVILVGGLFMERLGFSALMAWLVVAYLAAVLVLLVRRQATAVHGPKPVAAG